MVVSHCQYVRVKKGPVDLQFPRPRHCLRLLLRGPLQPSTDVTNVRDDEETRSQIDHRYKGNR